MLNFNEDNKILAIDVNNNLIENKSFLIIYFQDHSLEIFDLNNFTKIFENSMVSEHPAFLTSNQHYQEGNFETSISDFTIPILIKKEVNLINLSRILNISGSRLRRRFSLN